MQLGEQPFECQSRRPSDFEAAVERQLEVRSRVSGEMEDVARIESGDERFRGRRGAAHDLRPREALRAGRHLELAERQGRAVCRLRNVSRK